MDIDQRRELSKLRILAYLGDPEQLVYGSLTQDIEHHARPDWGAKAGARASGLLSDMQADGLIERRPGPRNGRPYFITQHGRDYLAKATENALFPEALAGWRAWGDELAEQRRRSSAERDVAAVLQDLPEFRGKHERIQTVAELLVTTLMRHGPRQR